VLTDWCDCCACRGGNPAIKIVKIPYDIAVAAKLVRDAKKEGVTIKPDDVIFVVEGARAIGCVRIVRRRLARLCGCWVDEKYRGRGLGEALVLHRIAYCEHHTVASVIDTYAFHKDLFIRLGFTPRADFKIGTTLLRKVIRGREEYKPE